MTGLPRFYLTGRVGLEGRRHADQSELHGPQGRLALVHLVVNRHRPVPIDRLAAALWGDELPPSWEPSLRALVSKLRRTLTSVAPGVAIASDGGCYQIRLVDAWVDLEAAFNAIDHAEGALRRGDEAAAWSEATVAAGIAQRPLLPGEDLPWIVDLRSRVHATWVRALHVLAQVHLAQGQAALTIVVARQLVEAEPYRESAYRYLMQAHLADGDRGEAVRVYTELRARLLDELGVDPTPASQAVHLAALELGGPERVRPRINLG